MVHPHFFEMVEHVCARGGQLKIETNGHYLDAGELRAPEGRSASRRCR